MIKIGNNNIEKINIQTIEGETTYVNAVEVGSKTIWTTPVKLWLNICPVSDGSNVTTQNIADAILHQDYNFVRKSQALNPESDIGNIKLEQDWYDDTNNLYCDLYYGDCVKFANRTVVITYTTTGMTTKTSHYRTDVAGNSYSLDTDLEGYKLDATNYPEFSIDINLLSCPNPENETPLTEYPSSGDKAKVYFPLKGSDMQWAAAQLTLTNTKTDEIVKSELLVWEHSGFKEANVTASVPRRSSNQIWDYTLEVGEAALDDDGVTVIMSKKSIMLQGSVTITGGGSGGSVGGGSGSGVGPDGGVDNM